MRYLVFVPLAALIFTECRSSAKRGKEQTQGQDSSVNKTGNPGATQGNVSINPVKITAAELPATIPYNGKLEEAWRWTDKLGENFLITSFTEPHKDKEKNKYSEEGKSAELYSYHFRWKESGYQLIWKISDGKKACSFDITCAFIKNATTITDLDGDGIAETTVQYSLACRSDVSPGYMKLIMHEDTAQYTLQGSMWIQSSAEDKFTVTERDVNLESLPKKKDEYEQVMQGFGRYETEKDFAGAPAGFLTHARSQWLKFVKERME